MEDVGSRIITIASRLALREGFVTTDNLPMTTAELVRALEAQDRIVSEMAAELGRLARSIQ